VRARVHGQVLAVSVETSIEWADLTVNPFHGCWGPGGTEALPKRCSYCYAHRMARRLEAMGVPGYSGRSDPFAPVFERAKCSDLVRTIDRMRRSRRVFLGSMGDLFGPGQWASADAAAKHDADRVQAQVRSIVSSASRHTFLLLTKTPEGIIDPAWPDNAQIGVSVTGRAEAAKRIPELLRRVRCGARWVSVEPLLDEGLRAEHLRWSAYRPGGVGADVWPDWVVIGAQSGPGAPLALVEVAAQLVVDLADRGVPVYVKPNMRRADPRREWPTQIE